MHLSAKTRARCPRWAAGLLWALISFPDQAFIAGTWGLIINRLPRSVNPKNLLDGPLAETLGGPYGLMR